MSITKLLTAIKGGKGSGNFGHSGRPGKTGGSAPSALAGMERTVNFDGNYLEIQYEKKMPHPMAPDYMVTDLTVGFPYIRGKLVGDALEIRAIGSGQQKRAGIGTAMVEDAMQVAGVTKIASTGVESPDGKQFLDALAAKGFTIVGRNA